ncbi:hypothetical protein G6F57_018779 [Rhizopus arrhizus]|nr:hypothetical protein G6F57_018779 [Rhizopus arrhizus]
MAGWPWAFYINLPLGALSLWYGAVGIAVLEPAGVGRGGRRGRRFAGGFRGLGECHAAPAGGFVTVQASHLSLCEPGHAELRHCVRDDVLRVLFLHDGGVALQPAARRPGRDAGAAAGHADGDPDRAPGRADGPPSVPGGGLLDLRGQRIVVPAGAGRAARVSDAMAAGPAAQRDRPPSTKRRGRSAG